MKKIILVRHPAYLSGEDPGISPLGERQSQELGKKLANIVGDADVAIWSSTAARAKGMAEIIAPILGVVNVRYELKLWADNWHRHDFPWLEQEIREFNGECLVIISHLDYVREFPDRIGGRRNSADYAQGCVVEMEQGTYAFISGSECMFAKKGCGVDRSLLLFVKLCSDRNTILFCDTIDYLSSFTRTEDIDLKHLQLVERRLWSGDFYF